MSLDGFRFSKDEITDLIEDMKLNGYSKAEIEDLDDINVFLKELAGENITKFGETDEEAIDKSEEPEFYSRYFFKDADDQDFYLDIYFAEVDEEDYDGNFFG